MPISGLGKTTNTGSRAVVRCAGTLDIQIIINPKTKKRFKKGKRI